MTTDTMLTHRDLLVNIIYHFLDELIILFAVA
jgi:hypothetical protein